MDYTSQIGAFQDLLIHQLVAEAAELLARGPHREYQSVDAMLSSPRGKINFREYVRQRHNAQAALPCTDYPRVDNCLVNRVLLAGLRFAIQLTADLILRGHLRRLVNLLELSVTPLPLSREVFARVRREGDRLTSAYKPALTLIELLAGNEGITIDDGIPMARLPGFLFDMNRFFQALLSRFLHEHLREFDVIDEYRLKGMFVYATDFNPRRRQAPSPRPDFVVQQDARIVAILDAKYRDLWAQPLPRDMLYQLALYALSQQTRRVATILYPTESKEATEARIEIRGPTHTSSRGEVILRPVYLLKLEQLLTGRQLERERIALAHRLAFGSL